MSVLSSSTLVTECLDLVVGLYTVGVYWVSAISNTGMVCILHGCETGVLFFFFP